GYRMSSGVLSQTVERLVGPGDRVLLGTAAGAALTLQDELLRQQDRLSELELFAGLQLGDYEFMGPVRTGTWAFQTWQVMPRSRADLATGLVGFHLCRGSAVQELIRRLQPDVFVTTVSPPDKRGEVSFGASVSYALEALETVPRVIAEINPDMPFTHGRTT